MLKRSVLASIVLLAFIFSSIATLAMQVKGIAKDTDGKPLAAAYVLVKEYPQFRITTKLDGSFVLHLPDSLKFPLTLEFSSVGYKDAAVKIKNAKQASAISAKLKPIESKVIFRTTDKVSDTTNKEKYSVVTTSSKRKSSLPKATRGKEGKYSEDRMSTLSLKNKAEEVSDFATIDVACRASTEGGSAAKVMMDGKPDMMPMPERPIKDGGFNTQEVAAGKLTAGELNDFSKWELWKDIAHDTLKQYRETWKMQPDNRYVVQLTTEGGLPVVDAVVYLKDWLGDVIWQAKTDNTGKAELWAQVMDDNVYDAGEPYTIAYEYQGAADSMKAKPFASGINKLAVHTLTPYPAIIKPRTLEFRLDGNNSPEPIKYPVDIDFIVDATGSMGDEIAYLQAELYDVIAKLQDTNPHIRLRTGSVFYRDSSDDYLTLASQFDTNYENTIDFIKQQSANGGGDLPEAVDLALEESIERRDWSETALARIAFLILDAPPHDSEANIARLHRQIRIAAMKGIRIVPLVCSGADKSTEYLMRSIALATNGTYVFLTDESGIGAPHIKPTTDKYEVEKLNHILLRVITEFCKLPENSKEDGTDISGLEKFVPKPYEEQPSGERLEITEVFNVYPNPFNGVLNIDVRVPLEDLYIADVTGKSLQNFRNVAARTMQVNFSDYANGIFFIHAYYEGRWYVTKVLLAR